VHTTGQLTNSIRSDDTPDLDGALREVTRKKILYYRKLYINRPDPIAFLPATASVLYHLPRRHMMSDFLTVLSVFVLIIVSSVTFLYPRSSSFFIQLQIDIQKKGSSSER
jgi:hypothetical protein